MKMRGLAHLLLTVCLLTIAGPTIALADARMQVDAERIYDSTGSAYDAGATTGQLNPHDGEDVHDVVYDGVTHLFAGMVDARADLGWRNAAKGGVRTAPRNLAEKLALDDAKGGAGKRIMQGKINDPKFPENVWAKMQHVHENPGGTQTVIHYWENLQTGAREGFKFK
jgi:hypothetical protein